MDGCVGDLRSRGTLLDQNNGVCWRQSGDAWLAFGVSSLSAWSGAEWLVRLSSFAWRVTGSAPLVLGAFGFAVQKIFIHQPFSSMDADF